MIRRLTAVTVLVVALTGTGVFATQVAGKGDATAVAAKKKKKKKKKKPPLIATGGYFGRTSNGIDMSLILNADRATGTMTYCGMIGPLVVSGNSFTVSYTDAGSFDTLVASGTFDARTRQATGSVLNNGCDSTNQTFVLQAP